MKKIAIDDLLTMIDSRYSLVTLVSKRARQIIRGQEVLVRTATIKPVCIAIEEFYENLYDPVYETEQQRMADAKAEADVLAHAYAHQAQALLEANDVQDDNGESEDSEDTYTED